MLKFIVTFGFFVLISGQKRNYTNYQVFNLFPTNEKQINLLKEFTNSHDTEYSFWKDPIYINETVQLMVGPQKIDEFENLMKSHGIEYLVSIKNVQRLVEKTNVCNKRSTRKSFDWMRYHTLEEIYWYLHMIAKMYPDVVELLVGGVTYENRWIMGVKLSFKDNNPGIFIEGGIHAREWISPATVTYILNELLTSNDAEVRQLAENNDWYIFPVFNPDGYVYTHTTDRLWRKNRKYYNNYCQGVDLNRNWDFKWMMYGASGKPCNEINAGNGPFSEIETRSLAQYITSISNKFYAYISFHSFGECLLFPYGDTTEHLDNDEELYAISIKAIEALAKRYGTRYSTGNIAELMGFTTGSSLDWVKANFRTPITFSYELRDSGNYGFLLPPDQIIPTGQETLDSLVALFKEAENRGIPRRT